MSNHEVEVTLARDLPVGPRGGLVKADEQVKLPYAEAQLLVAKGHARYEKKSAPVAVPAPGTTTAAGGAAAEGGTK